MKIAFIDDDVTDRTIMKTIVENYQEIIPYIYQSASDYFKAEKKVDALFLDIEMPDTNGLDVAVKIREENQEVPIIFISWHQKYEHQSFLVHPFSFIDKNNFKEELVGCINDLLKDFHRKNDDFILSNREHIPAKHILYMERQGHYTHIHMDDMVKSVKDYPLQNILDQQIYGFYLINKSVIINFYQVAKLCGKEEFIMKDGSHIEISRRKQKMIKEAYIKFKMR